VLNVFVCRVSELFDEIVLLFAKKVVSVAFVDGVIFLLKEITNFFVRFIVSLFITALN